jgi:hypothetical protein
MGVLLVLAVVAVLAIAARFAPFGHPFRHAQDLRVHCPTLGRQCDCRIEQEVYTGRFERVLACSAYPDRTDLPCDQGCLKRMNLGMAMPPAA